MLAPTLSEEVRKRMSSDHKYPCVHCYNDVVAVDMPRVMMCKPCFARLRKENYPHMDKYKTWPEYLSKLYDKDGKLLDEHKL